MEFTLKAKTHHTLDNSMNNFAHPNGVTRQNNVAFIFLFYRNVSFYLNCDKFYCLCLNKILNEHPFHFIFVSSFLPLTVRKKQRSKIPNIKIV
jgi:hypothetical protein